jgi:hypothetical protein
MTQPRQPLPKVLAYGLLISYLSVFLMFGASILVATGNARNINRESDARWCDLLSTLDTAYSSTPPSTELGRRVAQSIDDLRTEFECG